ncbi:MAG: hypothetical protein ABS876_02460 [Ruminococcus sp.]
MKKKYYDPEFELVRFSFERILEDPEMDLSKPEGQGAGVGED